MVYLVLLFLVVALDQWSKWWIVQSFSLYESQPVFPGFFSLTYITNTGAAFGFLGGEYAPWRQVFFVTVGCVALLVMAVMFKQFLKQGRIFAYALSLIAGGAIGNLIDRLRFGSVIDFLDFSINQYHWPAFNIADSAITVGVALFVFGHFIQKDQQEPV